MANVRVPSAASIKRRGWIAICAGVFLVIFMVGLAFVVASLSGSHAMSVSASVAAEFFGKLYVGFALIAMCGLVAIVNGALLLRTGKAQLILTFLTLAIFFSAIFVLWQASNVLPGS